jgi:ABC-2 type transport system permease protein
VLGGAGYCLIGLLGLGFGAVVRHTALAVGLLVGGVYVVAMLVAPLAPALMPWLPIAVVANSLTVVEPGMAIGDVRFLSPWAGLAVLVLYAAVALGAGLWVLAERDA